MNYVVTPIQHKFCLFPDGNTLICSSSGCMMRLQRAISQHNMFQLLNMAADLLTKPLKLALRCRQLASSWAWLPWHLASVLGDAECVAHVSWLKYIILGISTAAPLELFLSVLSLCQKAPLGSYFSIFWQSHVWLQSVHPWCPRDKSPVAICLFSYVSSVLDFYLFIFGHFLMVVDTWFLDLRTHLGIPKKSWWYEQVRSLFSCWCTVFSSLLFLLMVSTCIFTCFSYGLALQFITRILGFPSCI
jgi:hypothetical protein